MSRWRASTVAVSMVLGPMLLLTACGGAGEDLGGELLPADIAVLQAESAAAMGAVETVRFDLERSGGPIYIDSFKALSLESVTGRYSAPASADAVLTVKVNDSLLTKLGAVAIDGEVWLSNPVTGDFELLPTGYDIDPTTFFDPEDGWRPLLLELVDAEFVSEVNRGGTRYHIRGTAPAARVEVVTAGLVSGQDVTIDLWLHPVTAVVTAAEFSTTHAGTDTHWVLTLSRYGDEVVVVPPETSR